MRCMSMLKNKKALVMSVLCAIASVGFVMSASAENVVHGNLDEIVVEGSRDKMPGEMVNAKGSVGLLGDKDVMKTPFSVTNVAQKLWIYSSDLMSRWIRL